jgi:hypothetical protein
VRFTDNDGSIAVTIRTDLKLITVGSDKDDSADQQASAFDVVNA